MPLSSSTSRKRLHTRTAVCECFARDDGLFDLEAHLTDIKDHRYELMAGTREAGEPVHEMWVRVTIDREFTIHAVEARMDRMPYPGACNRIEAAYGKLVGRNLARNFRLEDEAMSKLLFDGSVTTFLEDKEMIEAQQKKLDGGALDGLVDITADTAQLLARRILDDLIRREADPR